RAAAADLLGFFGAVPAGRREEQVGVHAEAGGVVAPGGQLVGVEGGSHRRWPSGWSAGRQERSARNGGEVTTRSTDPSSMPARPSNTSPTMNRAVIPPPSRRAR